MNAESETTVLDTSALHLLHRAGQCAQDLFQAEAAAIDLTPRQFAVLVAVAEHQGLKQTDLVDRTGIDRSTMADLVRRMLKKGLLQRRRTKHDARAYSVKLTDRGEQALKMGDAIMARVDQMLLGSLPNRLAQEFVTGLERIVAQHERHMRSVSGRG